jgi:hypothetical protein
MPSGKGPTVTWPQSRQGRACWFSGVGVGGRQGRPRRGRAGRHAVRDALHTPCPHLAPRGASSGPGLPPGPGGCAPQTGAADAVRSRLRGGGTGGRHQAGRQPGARPGWADGPGAWGGRGLPEGGLLSPPSLFFLLFGCVAPGRACVEACCALWVRATPWGSADCRVLSLARPPV